MKRYNLFVIVILTILCIFLPTNTLANTYQDKALALQELGILKGSNQGFELDRELTRAEGATMLVRLLGVESLAIQQKNKHSFQDVPEWANDYVGYLYSKGLTKGISATKFGSQEKMTGNQYATFVLRALGYDDSKGDFQWNAAIAKSETLGITSKSEALSINEGVFLRGHMVGISFNSLFAKMVNTSTTSLLKDKLVETGAISREEIIKVEQSKVVVNNTDPSRTYITSFLYYSNQTYFVDYNYLPVEVKGFVKMSVGSLSNLLGGAEVVAIDGNTHAPKSLYNKELGWRTSANPHGHMAITFYGPNDKILKHYIVEKGTKIVYSFTTVDEWNRQKPKITDFLSAIQIHSGVSIDNNELKIERQKLPIAVQGFSHYIITTARPSVYTVLNTMVAESKYFQQTPFIEGRTLSIDLRYKVLLALYNLNGDIIGYYTNE